jgi:hypothetical protein
MAKQAHSSIDLGSIPLRLMERAWEQPDGHSCGRLVLKATAALLSNRYSFECATFVGVDVDSQDERTILKDAGEYAQSLDVDGTIEHAPISDPGETSDID